MSRWSNWWYVDNRNKVASWDALSNNEWVKVMRQYRIG